MHLITSSIPRLAFLGASLISFSDIYVDQSAANCGTGTGSAVDPVCSITDAIALAAPGDTVRIAPGTYVENVTAPFDLNFEATGTANVTIVDGGATGSVITIPTGVTVSIDSLTITNGRSDYGGGIKAEGVLVLTNSTVTDNFTIGSGPGGGIASGGGNLTIEVCTISDNFSPTGTGGGISNGGGIAIIRDSTVSGNRAGFTQDFCGYWGGGGIESSGGTLTITGSTISGNVAGCEGGGIWSRSATYISNSTVSGNSAVYTAGIYSQEHLFENVTVTRNSTPYNFGYGGIGGGIYSRGPANLHLIRNCLVAGNSTYYGASNVKGQFTSLGHNVLGTPGASGFVDGIDGDQVGSFANPLDPVLGPLQNNGGLTDTHALLPGSPALNAGDPIVFELFDQRGVARPFGGTPDVGSYEVEEAQIDVCNGDGGDQLGCSNCPCSNNSPVGTIGGCLNQVGASARLNATGTYSVSLPPLIATDLRFGLVGAPPFSFCLLTSGDSVAPQNPMNPCFGSSSGIPSMAFDGLRCADVNFRRHGGRSVDSNGAVGETNSPWGGEGGPPIGITLASGGFSAGQTRFFQSIYRENSLAGCMRGLNTSQAVEVTFTP